MDGFAVVLLIHCFRAQSSALTFAES